MSAPRSSGTVPADTAKTAPANSTAESRRREKMVPALRRRSERNSGPGGNHLTARFRTFIEWRTIQFATRYTNDQLTGQPIDEEMI